MEICIHTALPNVCLELKIQTAFRLLTSLTLQPANLEITLLQKKCLMLMILALTQKEKDPQKKL